jgi:hypothetical protein
MITGLAGRNHTRAAESYLTYLVTTTKSSTISPSKTKRTTMSKPSAQIPVIDISPSNPHAAMQLLDAAANNGFVFIENNTAAAMPPTTVENMFDLVVIFNIGMKVGG